MMTTTYDNNVKDNSSDDNNVRDNSSDDNNVRDNSSDDNNIRDNSSDDNNIRDNSSDDNNVRDNSSDDNNVRDNNSDDNNVRDNNSDDNSSDREQNEKCEPRTRQIKSVTHCFDIVLEFSQCVLQFMFPAGQFLLGLQLEGRDGWDQGTTGTDRYIGSFGGPQPAGPGADRDRSVVKST